MDHLFDVTLRRQIDAQRAATDELRSQVSELATLLREQVKINSMMVPAGAASGSATGASAAGTYTCEVPGTAATAAGASAAGASAAGVVAVANGPGAQVSVTQNTINIHVFGSEDTSHIGQAEIKSLLDKTLSVVHDPSQAALHALLGAATMIYSDPAHPQNLTCYIPNKKQDSVLVHGKEGWQVQPYKLILPPMITKSLDKLFNNQPFVNARRYGDLMIALKNNEDAYKAGREMRSVLVRNKDLLDKALGGLPK